MTLTAPPARRWGCHRARAGAEDPPGQSGRWGPRLDLRSLPAATQLRSAPFTLAATPPPRLYCGRHLGMADDRRLHRRTCEGACEALSTAGMQIAPTKLARPSPTDRIAPCTVSKPKP